MRNKVLTSYYKYKQGGLCTRLNRAINALAESGAAVHYISATEFPVYHKNCFHHKFPWPSKNRDSIFFWFFYIVITPFYSIYISKKYGINRLFAFEPTYAFLFKPAKYIFKIPLVVFLRADSVENYKIRGISPVFIAIANHIERHGLSNTHVVGVSKSCLDSVLARHKGISIRSSDVFRNDVPAASKPITPFPDSPLFRLSCAGVLENRKNQAFLVNLIKHSELDCCLLNIYGDGKKRPELECLAKTTIKREACFFRGWQERHEIFTNTDLLLVPSLHEGAPNIILESLGAEILLLASDIPEHTEILPAECTLPLIPEIWIESILKIIRNEKHRSVIKSKLLASREKLTFDWDRKFIDLISSSN